MDGSATTRTRSTRGAAWGSPAAAEEILQTRQAWRSVLAPTSTAAAAGTLLDAVKELVNDFGGIYGIGVLEADDLEVAGRGVLRQQAYELGHHAQSRRIITGDDQLVAHRRDRYRSTGLGRRVFLCLGLFGQLVNEIEFAIAEAGLGLGQGVHLGCFLFKLFFGRRVAAGHDHAHVAIGTNFLEHPLNRVGQGRRAALVERNDPQVATLDGGVLANGTDGRFDFGDLLVCALDDDGVA